jgi:hypothetical protein
MHYSICFSVLHALILASVAICLVDFVPNWSAWCLAFVLNCTMHYGMEMLPVLVQATAGAAPRDA